jgi:hypothetical protein
VHVIAIWLPRDALGDARFAPIGAKCRTSGDMSMRTKLPTLISSLHAFAALSAFAFIAALALKLI